MISSTGHLNPGAPDVAFDRFELAADLRELVRHVWVVRWSLPAGLVQPQRVLTYPAFNAVIQPDASGLFGPDSRMTVQELSGTSWVVGVLFRPAAGPVITSTPATALLDGSEPLGPDAPVAAITGIMAAGGVDQAAISAPLESWLRPRAARQDDNAQLVNEAARIAEQDPTLLRAADLAARLGVSPRSLERLTRRYIGMTPKWLIECRRLQQAATTLHADPDVDLTSLAMQLGYADYPHFFRQYERVIGESPNQTRARSGAAAPTATAPTAPAR